MSSNYYSATDPFSKFQTMEDQFGSTFSWMVAASIISVVVGTAAIVAIVFAIINCLNKVGSAIPTYAQVATSESSVTSAQYASKLSADTSTHNIEVTVPPAFPVITNSQMRTVTIEKFLSDIARERPIRFSPEQVAGFTNNYSTVLGSGGFGVVYIGEFPNGVKVAVKVLNRISDKRVEEQFMAEVSTIGRTNHVNLVRLYGFCFDDTLRALIYEYLENGSLDMFLFGGEHAVEWEKLQEIAIGTAKGIAYLHEECQQRIIHYDIKPGNILLDPDLTPKVADFGLAKLCNRDKTHVTMTGLRGTPGYAAPELWKPYPVTHKCDVYSFGMLLFEIMGRRRNHDPDLSETRQWLPRWTWEMFNKGELADLMAICEIAEEDRVKAERMSMVALWCVQSSPEARPLMSTVVKMLEGGIEIVPPPNPFQYLESSSPDLAAFGGSTTGSDSSSTVQSSQPCYSTARKTTFEIEIANSS
ncbi:PREDICTED: rust resistance kinase Lr10-like [Nelumbo nucifera]|uniref:Rust resistance kinase Lr10-like n=2 Tax=Nelumbo nucifera TaxID=4432 RepID=A0A1U7Z8L9_NELNU|nr:PREDICTED: rust resistance kinase Lr10-like [Nelumbo nucifera]XP_010243999.1 PREDICTED: rust resistance kinase Lr10-like [Nelumbo nucifera]DAD22606.1 TPA_asm: hypothetical protein HUJ06_024069 [Nelumbo nucifera]